MEFGARAAHMFFPGERMTPAPGKCQSPTVRDVCDIYLNGRIKNRAEKGRVEIRRTFETMLALPTKMPPQSPARSHSLISAIRTHPSAGGDPARNWGRPGTTARIPAIFRRSRQMGGVRCSAANSSPKGARTWSMSRKGNCWDHAPTESLWISPMRLEANWHAGQRKQAA